MDVFFYGLTSTALLHFFYAWCYCTALVVLVSPVIFFKVLYKLSGMIWYF